MSKLVHADGQSITCAYNENGAGRLKADGNSRTVNNIWAGARGQVSTCNFPLAMQGAGSGRDPRPLRCRALGSMIASGIRKTEGGPS